MLAVLKKATTIAQQHNLNSTASREERSAMITRHLDWWNYEAIPAISEAERKELR
jgi:hypothetical protein